MIKVYMVVGIDGQIQQIEARRFHLEDGYAVFHGSGLEPVAMFYQPITVKELGDAKAPSLTSVA